MVSRGRGSRVVLLIRQLSGISQATLGVFCGSGVSRSPPVSQPALRKLSGNSQRPRARVCARASANSQIPRARAHASANSQFRVYVPSEREFPKLDLDLGTRERGAHTARIPKYKERACPRARIAYVGLVCQVLFQ